MFAYIDETGHSGRNIFDKNESFQLGTLLSVIDISAPVRVVLDPFLEHKGVERLHANEWPEHELVNLAHSMLDRIGECGPWSINLFNVHKPYIAPTKFVDMIFDPGENNATPDHWYWDEMHRHVLCLVTDSAMSRGLAEKFWEAFLNDNAEDIISGVCQRSCPPISCRVSDFRGADFGFGVEPDGSGGFPVTGVA